MSERVNELEGEVESERVFIVGECPEEVLGKAVDETSIGETEEGLFHHQPEGRLFSRRYLFRRVDPSHHL